MNELQRLQLKYDGLLQRVAKQASTYEGEIAELRVQLTLAMNELERQETEMKEAPDELVETDTPAGPTEA